MVAIIMDDLSVIVSLPSAVGFLISELLICEGDGTMVSTT